MIKRYNKRRRRAPHLFRRYQGGGYSSNRKRQRDVRKKKAMEDLTYYDVTDSRGTRVEVSLTADEKEAPLLSVCLMLSAIKC